MGSNRIGSWQKNCLKTRQVLNNQQVLFKKSDNRLMNEKELCKYIKTHFKAEKGTILFFYLSEVETFSEIKPVVLRNYEELEQHVPKGIFYALIDAIEDEVVYTFSCDKFQMDENLSLGHMIQYQYYFDVNPEQIRKELKHLLNTKIS